MPLGGFTPRDARPAGASGRVAGTPSTIPAIFRSTYTTLDLGNVTVRQLVRVSQGGTRLRLRFSNENNAGEAALGGRSCRLRQMLDGTVVAGSDRVVTFDGQTLSHPAAPVRQC